MAALDYEKMAIIFEVHDKILNFNISYKFLNFRSKKLDAFNKYI